MSSRNNRYIYGSEALDYEYYEERQERKRARRKEDTLRSRQAACRRSAGQLILTAAMIFGLTISVISYIQLTSAVSASRDRIASAESQIEKLKLSNDQKLEEINASINLDDIKYRAINELGMRYADKDQIVVYSNEDDDYAYQAKEVK